MAQLKHFGYGDKHFAAITVYYDRSGKPELVEIPHAGRSGAEIYSAKLFDANVLASLSRTTVGAGGHVQALANAVARSFTSGGFNTHDSRPGKSLSTMEGSRWALALVHETLIARGQWVTNSSAFRDTFLPTRMTVGGHAIPHISDFGQTTFPSPQRSLPPRHNSFANGGFAPTGAN